MRRFVFCFLILIFVSEGLMSAELASQPNDGDGTVLSTREDGQAGSGAFDVLAADDFVVPSGQTWSVAALDFCCGFVDCRTKRANQNGFNIFIFEDAGGLPGAVLHEFLQLQPAQEGINLAYPVLLSEGHYWIGIQYHFEGDDLTCGGHLPLSAVQTNHPFAWRTGDYGAFGCSDWNTGMVCNPDGTSPDLSFALYDTPFRAAVPALGPVGLIVLAGLLVGVGLVIRRPSGNV